jgi:hypothetical protein
MRNINKQLDCKIRMRLRLELNLHLDLQLQCKIVRRLSGHLDDGLWVRLYSQLISPIRLQLKDSV